MAVSYKWQWDQGTTIIRVLTWKRNQAADGEPADYQPVDLTGYSGRMEIKDRIGGTVLHRLDTDDGTMVIDGPSGKISWEIDAETTAAWTWRNAVYDLELVDPDGRVTRLIQGTISLSPEVTTGD